MSVINRDEINIKLIELIKSHEILYNLKYANFSYFEERRKLWNEIAEKMNKLFKMKLRKYDSVRQLMGTINILNTFMVTICEKCRCGTVEK